jgi:hypothetical protein
MGDVCEYIEFNCKLEIDMYCYRGIKYNTKDLKKQVKKAKKSDTVTYRGITGKIAA